PRLRSSSSSSLPVHLRHHRRHHHRRLFHHHRRLFHHHRRLLLLHRRLLRRHLRKPHPKLHRLRHCLHLLRRPLFRWVVATLETHCWPLSAALAALVVCGRRIAVLQTERRSPLLLRRTGRLATRHPAPRLAVIWPMLLHPHWRSVTKQLRVTLTLRTKTVTTTG
ncbi:hypothetical protein LPJ60_005451, partial [Coemansia sp. RSA 2675]